MSETLSDAQPHPEDRPVSFAAVDIRAELASRPYRPPHYEAEDRALAVLAAELAENPRNMLQKLVETALVLCRADTAGVSLLEAQDGTEVFRWEALAGVFAAERNNTMPRDASPCGVCIDQNTTELMYLADRCFPALRSDPRFVEALLVPFHYQGRPIGTVWVVTHQFDRKFDREDERVIRTLSAFASAAWQLWQGYDELERRVAERTAALSESNGALTREIEERKRSEGEQRRLLQCIETSQEEERRRIAREMHDQFGQQLTALRLKLATLKRDCGEQTKLREQIESLQAIGKQLDADIDFLVWELHPTALDDLGLIAALSKYVQNWSKHFDVHAELHTNGIEKDSLTIEIETVLYRIAQEALNNVAKHAKAGNVDVLLESLSGQISLIVEDDGVGFEEAQTSSGVDQRLGLVGMRERAALVGGTFAIESHPGSGSTVGVRIPVPVRSKRGRATWVS
jgi:signal transduction histidine kinase